MTSLKVSVTPHLIACAPRLPRLRVVAGGLAFLLLFAFSGFAAPPAPPIAPASAAAVAPLVAPAANVVTPGVPVPMTDDDLQAVMAKLTPSAIKLGKPQPGDWLTEHEERGQTFAQYLLGFPVTPTAAKQTIYIQPLGNFTAAQRRLVTETAAYIALFYHLPVKVVDDLPASLIPASARRVGPLHHVQFLTTYVIEDLLPPRLPKDAFAYIAFTATDLWPGEGWNFVFGQASLRSRVGVWSVHRFGQPEDPAAYALCLRRTLSTATHELGHMFSLWHCTSYACLMNGSNNLAESDREPLPLCPICQAKILHAQQATAPLLVFPATPGAPRSLQLAALAQYYTRLADYCRAHDLPADAQRYADLAGAAAAP